jgi:tetratricopeptide (TPR) repeat protein
MTNQTIYKQAWKGNLVDESTIDILKNDAALYPYFSAIQILQSGVQLQQSNADAKLIKAKAYTYCQHPIAINMVLSKCNIQTNTDLSDIMTPAHADNYFAAIKVEATQQEVDEFVKDQKQQKGESISNQNEQLDENSLMITRSFEDWLNYFKTKKEKEKKEKESKESVRALWQKEKLSAANEEENELIPENVFKMAIDSINLSDSAISESLAEILLKQGKSDKAMDMYRKLSLLNPEKSSYFASKLKEISKQQ